MIVGDWEFAALCHNAQLMIDKMTKVNKPWGFKIQDDSDILDIIVSAKSESIYTFRVEAQQDCYHYNHQEKKCHSFGHAGYGTNYIKLSKNCLDLLLKSLSEHEEDGIPIFETTSPSREWLTNPENVKLHRYLMIDEIGADFSENLLNLMMKCESPE